MRRHREPPNKQTNQQPNRQPGKQQNDQQVKSERPNNEGRTSRASQPSYGDIVVEDIAANTSTIVNILSEAPDLVIRSFTAWLSESRQVQGQFIFLDGLVDDASIQSGLESISKIPEPRVEAAIRDIADAMRDGAPEVIVRDDGDVVSRDRINVLSQSGVKIISRDAADIAEGDDENVDNTRHHSAAHRANEAYTRVVSRTTFKDFKTEASIKTIVDAILHGYTAIFFQGARVGFLASTSGPTLRATDEPPSQTVVRGSREGFIESARSNLTLLRRRIVDARLRFEDFTIGEISHTLVTMVYLEGLSHPKLLNWCRDRLEHIAIDSILTSGELEQYIEEAPLSIFPTIGNTERPDTAASLLMEGHIVLMVDGDPVALFGPYPFVEAFQVIEDYSSRSYYSSLVRFLRMSSFILSIALPSLFVAGVNFQKEIIPTDLLAKMTMSREAVPFPTVMEVFFMILLFEVVREAGIRMPRPIGQAVSIVGGLILGQVSVQAGLVGAPTIIVVSLAAIVAFLVNPLADAIGVLRVLLLVPTAIFGFYGIILALVVLHAHMVSLKTFGEPYMAPFAPLHFDDWKDTVFRLPLNWTRRRPTSIPNLRPIRVTALPNDKTGNRHDH